MSVESRKRVLVVDDDETLHRGYGSLLADYEIKSSYTVKEALALLEHDHDFAALLVDIMLPDESGVSLYEKLGIRWPNLQNRVVFVTGIVPNREIGEFLTSVKNPLLLKPFTPKSLQEIVRKAVQGELGQVFSAFTPESSARSRLLDVKATFLLQQIVMGLLIPGFLHRLNNSMTGGLCHLQLSMEGDEQKQFASDAFESMKKAVSTIGLLEELARLQSSKPHLFSLQDCVEQAATLVAFLPRFRNVRLIRDYRQDSSKIWGNAGVLVSLILILLADAEIPLEENIPEIRIRIEEDEGESTRLSFECPTLTLRDPRLLAEKSAQHSELSNIFRSSLDSLFQVNLSFVQEINPGQWHGFIFHFANEKEKS